MEKIGLYVGKFAPLHKGHQHVIETAMDEVDTLYLIIYDEPSVTDIPLTVRESWINEIYPSVKTLHAWDAPDERGYNEEIKKAHELHTQSILPENLNITHFYSSEDYGKHMSEFFDAKDRRIDQQREKIPISGTKIRNNTYQNKEYLDERVYRDLVTKVTFLLPPQLEENIAEKMAEFYDTEYTNSFKQKYKNMNSKNKVKQNMITKIAKTYLKREEDRIQESDTFFFTDANPITLSALSQYYNKYVSDYLEHISRNSGKRYDIHILIKPTINDNDIMNENEKKRIYLNTKSILDEYRIPYYIISQDNLSVSRVRNIIENEDKWDLSRDSEL